MAELVAHIAPSDPFAWTALTEWYRQISAIGIPVNEQLDVEIDE